MNAAGTKLEGNMLGIKSESYRPDIAALRTCLLIAGLMFSPTTLAIVGGSPVDGRAAEIVVRVGICSGLLVAYDVILTAAHCDNGFVIWQNEAGARFVSNRQVRAASSRVDLALMKVERPAVASIAPALLSAELPQPGDRVSIVGFGESVSGKPGTAGTLRSATVYVQEAGPTSRDTIWVGDGGTSGACTGDSGGVLLRDRAVVGMITSIFGPCGMMTIVVPIGPEREWIDRTLDGWGRNALWTKPQ